MTYFKFLSIVLGSWMVLGGAWAAFSLESLRRLIVELYPEVRPRWIPVVGAAVLALVLWTWVEFVKFVNTENFVVTLVVSLGLAKVVPLVFFYKKSREFLMALVAEPLAFRVVVLSSAAVGFALLMMGIFF
ncbi:MAG: hypothetical protein A2351_03815 [Omnitrophica bacterium RIFOXYB12_FULL_50_7]|nr:MAG: hypothetical protein A2351_03815 [Omnitrophica bacterium RIFOXYB12_FULL_50_7]